jgi:hypothetical protein
MLYEFLSERFGSDESRRVQTTESVPLPPARPSQQTLRPVDLAPPWRGPQPTDTPRDERPGKGRIESINFFAGS